MKTRYFVLMLCCIFLLSCAAKQPIAIEGEAPPSAEVAAPEPEKDLILPDIAPRPKPAADVKKAASQQAPLPESEEKDKYVMLNFENADLETVIATIGEMLKINYILAPGVTGKITIQSHNKIPLSEVFPTFQTALEFNGLTAVKEGSFYRIVPIDTVKQQPVPIKSGKQAEFAKDASFVTQEVPLEYVKANDVANIVRNLMPRGTDIIVYEPANLLIVTAPPSGIVKLMKLLEAIDIPSTEQDAVKTFVYDVENGEAKKLADVLRNIYKEEKDGSAAVRTVAPATTTTTTTQPRAPIPARTRQPAAAQAPAGATVQEGLAAQLEGNVIIEAYEDINALIIKATPRAYLSLLETIKRIDVQPKQVLIEVLIAEISLTDETQLGLEWLVKGTTVVDGDTSSFVGGFSTGKMTYEYNTTTKVFDLKPIGELTKFFPTAYANIFDPDKFNALIYAAAATGNVNVLASPHILALDNKEAKIEIADEVPVATSISQSQTAPDNTLSQVQFKSAGIILTVTPQINEKKQVNLKISQEVSELGEEVLIAGKGYQGFKTRKATTNAIVQDGHTLVIGGIISERIEKSRTGIPLLSDIPILGYLFGVTTDSATKRELILMVTPHVVGNREEADNLTQDYLDRVKELKRKIEKRKKKLSQSESHWHTPETETSPAPEEPQ